MKIIEGLKKIKDLLRKASDLQAKVKTYCCNLDCETETYPDQKAQIKEWIQAHSDILKEICDIRVAIQKTNIETEVSIQLNGKAVTKNIASWIHRRRDLAGLEKGIWESIDDGRLREGTITQSTGEKKEVKIRRYYDPKQRDEKIELYRSEPSTIDSTLEITNAVTDLIGI